MSIEKQSETSLSRREALKKLAKLSGYSAPTVTVLLSSSLSYAQGSGVMTPAECRNFTNRNPNRTLWPNAADDGGNGMAGIGRPNTVADCGLAGNNSNAN